MYTVRSILTRQILRNKEIQPKGIILPEVLTACIWRILPHIQRIFELGIPVLGICYGAQLMMHLLGGQVGTAPVREYGKIEVYGGTVFQDV